MTLEPLLGSTELHRADISWNTSSELHDRVSGCGFVSRCRVQGLGFRVWGQGSGTSTEGSRAAEWSRVQGLQGYLALKKLPTPSTLQYDYA